MKKNARLFLLGLGIAIVAAAGAFYLIRKEPWLSAETAYQKGDAALQAERYGKAFKYFKMAANKKPEDSRYSWVAAKMAIALRNPNAAYLYAQKAWKSGRKEHDVLNVMVQYSFFSDKAQKLDYALSLIKQMGDNVDKEDVAADIFLGFGETEKARRLLEKIFDRNPQPVTAGKLAGAYLQEGKDTIAFSFLTSCRAKQLLNEDGYGILARLYAKRGDAREAERCYQEGAEVLKTSERLQYNHAVFLMDTKNFDRAASMLDSLISKYPDQKVFETMRIAALLAKGDFATALSECGKSTAPIRIVAPLRANALIAMNRLGEAEAAFDTALAHNADLKVHLEFGNFLLFKAHKSEKARTVFLAVRKDHPDEPVANLGLASIAIDAGDTALARRFVDAVVSEKKQIPYVHLLLAQINLLEKNPKTAIEECDKLLAAMPGFEKAIFVKSQAYGALGELGKADELLTSIIHSSHGGEPGKTDWLKNALLLVKMKEKKYNDALNLVNEIDHAGDNAISFQRIRLEIYGLNGNLAKARETLASLEGRISVNEFANFKSWIAELSGDTLQAVAVLEPTISSKINFMRWAGLSIHLGKTNTVIEKSPEDSMTAVDWDRLAAIAQKKALYEIAAQCFKRALKHDPENAILLNNFAWATVQTPGFNQEEALKAIRKAFISLAGRSEVVQTYAEVLNKCNKFAECIKILQDKPGQTKENPALLYQLALAYEKSGDLRGAISSLRMMLKFSDSAPDWPTDAKRADLEAKVEKIKQQLGQ